MIQAIRNRFLRGLATWLLALALVLAFPFLVLFGGAVDAWRAVNQSWRDSKDDRRLMWRLMTFRSVG